jgi:hypothetical protein
MKAFPTEHPIRGMMDLKSDGMDLRDYFAAKAMQAIIGKSDDASLNIDEIDNWIGSYAYVVADAMMKEREK